MTLQVTAKRNRNHITNVCREVIEEANEEAAGVQEVSLDAVADLWIDRMRRDGLLPAVDDGAYVVEGK